MFLVLIYASLHSLLTFITLIKLHSIASHIFPTVIVTECRVLIVFIRMRFESDVLIASFVSWVLVSFFIFHFCGSISFICCFLFYPMLIQAMLWRLDVIFLLFLPHDLYAYLKIIINFTISRTLWANTLAFTSKAEVKYVLINVLTTCPFEWNTWH